MTNQLPLPHSLSSILNDVAELGSRIGALGSLGAGFAAALRVGTVEHDDVAVLLDGYASSLVALLRKVASDLEAHANEPATVDTSVRGHFVAGECAPVQLTRNAEGTSVNSRQTRKTVKCYVFRSPDAHLAYVYAVQRRF